MLRLLVNDDRLIAEFFCEFCDVTYKWPFPARTLWKGQPQQQSYPDARHVIMSHFIGDSNLSKFKFPRCPKQGGWVDTAWETVDVPSRTVVQRGTVKMVNQWPLVS